MRNWLCILFLCLGCGSAFGQEAFEGTREGLSRDLLGAVPQNIRDKFLDKLNDRTIADQILRAYDERYAAAAAKQDKGNEDCIKDYRAILEKTQGNFLLDHFMRAECLFKMAQFHVDNDEFEEAVKDIEELFQKEDGYVIQRPEARYLLGLSCAKLSTKDNELAAAAQVLFDSVIKDEDAPIRYRDSASWLLEEVKRTKDGRLANISNRAEKLQKRIENGETGKDVQKKQDQLIKELDALVEKAEEKEEETMGRTRPGKPGESPGNDPDKAKKEKLSKEQHAKNWQATMSDLERARALQMLDKMPLHYRELINQYYKSLAETQPKKKKE